MGIRISEAGLEDEPEHLWNVLTRLCLWRIQIQVRHVQVPE
jgi:hypothetical protein